MKSITKSENGTYRWYYEFDMLKNPMVIRTVFKIFFYILLGLCAFLILLDIIEGNFGVTSLIETTKAMGITAAILFGLSIISYFILAGIYGFKYCVLFEMNDEGIKQAKEANDDALNDILRQAQRKESYGLAQSADQFLEDVAKNGYTFEGQKVQLTDAQLEEIIRKRFNGNYPVRKSIQTNFAHQGGENGLLFQVDGIAYKG